MTLARPEKLSWVTIPLTVNIVLGVLSLLMLPFLGALINSIVGMSTAGSELTADDMAGLEFAQMFTGATLWVAGLVGVASLIFQFFVLRAVQQGRNWGRIAAIVIFALSLLSFPFGTILGIFGLIGALDQDVQRYASR